MQEQWGFVLTDVPQLSVSASPVPSLTVSYSQIPILTVNR